MTDVDPDRSEAEHEVGRVRVATGRVALAGPGPDADRVLDVTTPPSGPYPDVHRAQQGGQTPAPGAYGAPPAGAYGTPAPGGYGAPTSYPTPQRPGMAATARPVHGAPAYAGPPVQSVWHPRSASGGGSLGGTIALLLVGFASLWGLWIVLSLVGIGNGIVAFVAALLPLIVVLAAVMWLDRWEPEPKLMLLFALLWGAGVSVVLSFYGNTWVAETAYALTGDPVVADVVSSVVSAPIVEETTKGLGVLVIFLMRRSYFDGVVDGIVYAAVVAAGFAFTENILYFGASGSALASTFVMRGLLSPFAHVLFTACTGIALGIASRSRNRNAAWWMFPLGLLSAALLHALWNASATLAGFGGETSFFTFYILVQVPLFAAAVILAFWLRRQEAAAIAQRLGEYAAAGWFAPHEVAMVASLRQRSQARAWAARKGPRAGTAMKSFIRDATSLAYLRQRAATGRSDLRAHTTTETELLGRIRGDRQAFLTAAGPLG
ncbi:MAG: hypothetical protein BGO96_15980 [Micrococcales bacterium 73-15]|nr:MAG: hypothetical protein BGO96_15980 [Micrococcales bacterium 73-15]